MSVVKSLLWLGMMLVVCASGMALAAQTIYTWVDAGGARHFSETPPGAEIAHFDILQVSTSQAVSRAAPVDYRAALEVAESLHSARLARERMRLERREAAARVLEARRETERRDEMYRSPVYYGPYYRYPWYHKPYGRHPPGHHRPPGHGQRPVPGIPKRVDLNRR